jgi:hypothetical protein
MFNAVHLYLQLPLARFMQYTCTYHCHCRVQCSTLVLTTAIGAFNAVHLYLPLPLARFMQYTCTYHCHCHVQCSTLVLTTAIGAFHAVHWYFPLKMLCFLSSGRFLFLPPPRPLRCRLLDAVCCALRDHRCVLDIRYVTPILVLSSTDRRHHALVLSQKKSVSKASLELQIIQATEWRVVRKHL